MYSSCFLISSIFLSQLAMHQSNLQCMKNSIFLNLFSVRMTDNLGFGELMNMVSQVIGSIIIILFPVSKINKFYFLCGIVQVLGFLVIVSGHWFVEFSKPLYIIGMIIYGLGRAPGLFPYLMLHSIFNRP